MRLFQKANLKKKKKVNLGFCPKTEILKSIMYEGWWGGNIKQRNIKLLLVLSFGEFCIIVRILISGKVGKLCPHSSWISICNLLTFVLNCIFSNPECKIGLGKIVLCPLHLTISVHMKQWKGHYLWKTKWICSPKWPENAARFSVNIDLIY